MKEKALRFGKTTSLAGVLTEPRAGSAGDGRPAVILLNSGILHRVGACRLHVRIARVLAADGFTTLRFDFAGVGDSEARRDSLSFEEGAIVEVREAMDHLAAARGARSFVLMGLCSGADMAHLVARADERVAGLVMLDAWAYRTARYYLHHYGPRLAQPAVWKNFLAVRLRGLSEAARSAPSGDAGLDDSHELPTYVREFPAQSVVEADLRAFVARGIHLLHVFSGGQSDCYNHRGQYRAAFRGVPFGGLLQEEFLPDADHIFTGLQHQEFILRTVAAWMAGRWPSAAPARTAQPVASPAPAVLTYAS